MVHVQSDAGTLSHAKARVERAHRTIGKTFQVPAGLQIPFAFWRDIYATYDKDHVVLHDTEHLDIVYGVVDLTDISRRTELPPTEIPSLRRARVGEAMARVRALLQRLHDGATDLTAEEKRIQGLFARVKTPDKYKAAMTGERLRSQTGQRDKFIAGVIASGRYMPMIEKIFKEQGVPWEISRLVFVESMFNLRAYSKAGASGIWQFMPGTARLYGLARDASIDERNDPVAATQAAARLLKTDHGALGAWPLAINAYNAGRGRLQQAVARLGTTDIARIIQRFDHPGYGFASRNFYPEFLAALSVYENARQHFGDLAIDPPLDFEAIVTTTPLLLPELARLAQTPIDQLQTLNPGFADEVMAGGRMLPSGYTLKIPANTGTQFLSAIAQMDRGLRDRGYYVVRKGETVPSVSAKIGVSQQELRAMNNLRGAALTPGQVLRLPGTDLTTIGTAAATSE